MNREEAILSTTTQNEHSQSSRLPRQNFAETIKNDILNHSDDTTYEALFITASTIEYGYHVTCEHFAAVCKDPTYISQCIIQAESEDRHPSTAKEWFPNPQPFEF
ncbi:hypothetical protein BDV29DRAFT_162194 [Aspergillus leporis]|jgi:hypothetical protein|uniref:Uncharacterized protein n=1 Tax=Aspergillus leporis TaxID=41062 RepID=A0A5N5WMZ3_9EURO|nr:hypothetical protein BDV29DRAFT_162194 [Aspergillus leporis]